MSRAENNSRRQFLLGAASVTVVSAVGAAAPPRPSSLTALSAGEAVTHMSQGDIAVETYAEALIKTCAAHRELNAFISFEPQRVLEQARECDVQRRKGAPMGPLFGLPVPIKDSVNTRDYATSAGTPALKDFRPAEDAPAVSLLKAAGALLLGKTNLHELSYGWTSDNQAFGAVHNPYDPQRIPGGSSGGSAAAVAARMAPAAIAEDTEGSIRIPAAYCGLAGFRPTTGRYPTRGCVPISPLFDQIGPLARTVNDLIRFDAVLSGDATPLPPKSLRGVRFGVVRDFFYRGLDPEIERLTDRALARLKGAGAVLVEGTLPGLAALLERTTLPVQSHDVRLELTRYLKDYGTGVSFAELVARSSPNIRDQFRIDVLPDAPQAVSDAAYAQAVDHDLPALRRLYQTYFSASRVAAVIFPTARMPPPRIGQDGQIRIRGREVAFDDAVSRNIAPGSTAGLPGLVVPTGLTTEGLPASLEFDGPHGSDRDLLSLGIAIEGVLGRLPPPPGYA
jgi:Asp-tRNA(Asn)/Glu-tRNA(Gln) amidotransferase A subunit family amidase